MVKQLLAGAGQLAQLDDGVIGGLPTAQTLGVGAQRRGEHPRVATVILGAGDREAVPETVELLGVDRIDGEASLQEALDHGSVRAPRWQRRSRPQGRGPRTGEASSPWPKAPCRCGRTHPLQLSCRPDPARTHGGSPIPSPRRQTNSPSLRLLCLRLRYSLLVGTPRCLPVPVLVLFGTDFPLGVQRGEAAGTRVPVRCSKHSAPVVVPGCLPTSHELRRGQTDPPPWLRNLPVPRKTTDRFPPDLGDRQEPVSHSYRSHYDYCLT